MYCVSIGNQSFEEAKNIITGADMAEIRVDLCGFSLPEIAEFCRMDKPLIFTFRKNESTDDHTRLLALQTAIEHQAAWIDMDIDEDPVFFDQVVSSMNNRLQTKLIISYHNYENTPTNLKLFDIIIRAMEYSPELIKIACLSHGIRDNKRVLGLNQTFNSILAFCMGEKGKSTRAISLLLGAPFAYVALPGNETAPGQMTISEMDEMLARYGKKPG